MSEKCRLKIDFTIMNRLMIPLQKFTLLAASCDSNSYTTVVLNCFSFRSSVAVCDDFQNMAFCARAKRDFCGEYSSLELVSSSFSSLSTQCFYLVFLPNNDPV